MAPEQPDQTPLEEKIFLMGWPPPSQFLGAMKPKLEDQGGFDLQALTKEWRQANDRVQQLTADEQGLADNPDVRPLPEELQDRVDSLRSNRVFQEEYGHVPVDFRLVRLDQLVVHQDKINLGYVETLKERIGPDPSHEELFDLCFPFDEPLVPFQAARVGQNKFAVVSDSTDLRFLEAVPLEAEQVDDWSPSGKVARVIGLVVGYGSNCLSAISAQNRLILHNGSHRAYALRDLGMEWAPFLIKKPAREAELDLILPQSVKEQPDLYLQHPRPPTLKDYFDPELRLCVELPKKSRQILVSFGVDQLDVPGRLTAGDPTEREGAQPELEMETG